MGVLRRAGRAATDLIEIWTYVADRNRAAADRIVLNLDGRRSCSATILPWGGRGPNSAMTSGRSQ